MDQRVEEQAALSLASQPLKKDVVLLGSGVVRLRLKASASDADVVARVVDEYPTGSSFPAGFSTIVATGWLRASHRVGHSKAAIAPLVPGKMTDLRIELWPSGYRIAKGHRLRIDVTSADTPRFMPQTTPVDLTVDLGASRATLPTIDQAAPLVLTSARN
jgi:predicted acyl esterase